MLSNDKAQLQNPESKESQTFRKRFRVPYPIFMMLVDWTKGWYEKADGNGCINSCDAIGNRSIPTDLKVLAVLRILGRGLCLDDIEELSGISASTTRVFFHMWTIMEFLTYDERFVNLLH
jgi:hypothetical protein